MKKTIKLKESQLRQLVRESIMNVLSEEQLNELDPRTYAAARDEQNRKNQEYDQQMQAYNNMNPIKRAFAKAPQMPKGYYNRANKFQQAGVNRFNSMYGGTEDGVHMSNNGNVNVTRRIGDEQNTTTYDYNANQNKSGVQATPYGRGVVTNTAYNMQTGKETKGPSYGMNYADIDYNYRNGNQTPTAKDKAIKMGGQMANGTGRYDKQIGKWS